MANTEVAVTDKPLNQTQLKNLREIVSGDFEDLQALMTKEEITAAKKVGSGK